MRRSFSLEDRLKIEQGLELGESYTTIAQRMGRPRKSIYNEFRKNSIGGIYRGEQANDLAKARKKNRKDRLRKKLTLREVIYILERRNQGISIDILSAELATDYRIIRQVLQLIVDPFNEEEKKPGLPERIRELEEKLETLGRSSNG